MLCVPGCRSNYEGDYVSVFKFPSEHEADLRQQWVNVIPRKDWTPTKNSVVCIKHFSESDVIVADKFTDKSGIEHLVPRDKRSLKPNVFPSIFPNLPSYLSLKPHRARKDPSQRAIEVNTNYEHKVNEWLEQDIISSFEVLQNGFINKLADTLQNKWKYVLLDGSCLVFYTVDIESDCAPSIDISVKISPDMTLKVYIKNEKVGSKQLKWIIENRLERWSQLENLLSHYNNNSDQSESISSSDELIQIAHEMLMKAAQLLSPDAANAHSMEKTIIFHAEQLKLLTTPANRRRYSSSMLCFAFMLHIKSPACYKFIRRSELLYLPHQRTLSHLSKPFSLTDNTSLSEYLKVKQCQLSETQKIIAIQMDEIHVKSCVSYSGGRLVGSSSNNREKASTVQAFLISSVFGSYTDVVGLM